MDNKLLGSYLPLEERTGNESVVYFTRDLSADGLIKAFRMVNEHIDGKVAVKIHSGEPQGPNIIPRSWVKRLLNECIDDPTLVETNTYYQGPRYETADHLKTIKENGWDFAKVDIMDKDGVTMLPVTNGKWFKEMAVGKSLIEYDSMVVLTHYKGHAMGGFGGSNKNIGIGCADGRIGKGMIHAGDSGKSWGVVEDELMERISESAKATVDYFGDKITYVNIMRNMSVDCDCAGVGAAPVVTPNVGILSSRDICAIDTACTDIVFAMKESQNKDLVERIMSRHGLRQLSYMQELGMGNSRYKIIDLDNGNKQISLADCVKDLVAFKKIDVR